MLGEAALTAADAARYLRAYEQAIDAIGRASAGRGILDGPGISIKLSALHPRYQRAQIDRVHGELYPVLSGLALRARSHDIAFNIDAEESDRLELSLDLLERLCAEPALADWDGIGFVVQAYQKRCPAVIDALVDLARRSRHRLMVRLVKGAYWDSEIKRAQVEGLDGYPVYTRKAYTDVAYLACARRLLAAPDAVFPQFATHNAHTLAAIHQLADPARYTPGQYEFQCLHGMGEPLYEQVVGPAGEGRLARPCRIYAPVGTHETLLAYLVRRLLENGANTSFVHRIADPSVPLDTLVEDPVLTVERFADAEGAPRDRPAASGDCAAGRDLRRGAAQFARHRSRQRGRARSARRGHAREPRASLDCGAARRRRRRERRRRCRRDAGAQPRRPQRHRRRRARDNPDEIERALASAAAGASAWAATPVGDRAAILERAADGLEAELPLLLGLLAREAGKTIPNGIAEVREAVDFLRFYAAQARRDLADAAVAPLGPVVCISPWNFPLAIFTGQIAAALAAGNPVLAKPAEQTPLVAAEMVRRLLDAGAPANALQLVPGRGETVGAALVADARVEGVMFTGSTDVARLLQRSLAKRLGRTGRTIPLVAETGGQNAMLVDSSALAEQVVSNAVASAFDSAGQRCSALRVLCVQEDGAIASSMLRGAMAESRIGRAESLAVDVGPVIDADARDAIEAHVAAMAQRGRRVFRQARADGEALERGTFVLPTVIELDRIGELDREIFGPVLHVVRFRRRDLAATIGQINATGYGLTLGVQSRIDETIAEVLAAAHVGNVYVNRNMVGAVVGVQPFGGEGLSGTGPKAGGPLYLMRLLARPPADAMVRALRDSEEIEAGAALQHLPALRALQGWAELGGDRSLAGICQRFAELSGSGSAWRWPGPPASATCTRCTRAKPCSASPTPTPIASSSSPRCSRSAAVRSGLPRPRRCARGCPRSCVRRSTPSPTGASPTPDSTSCSTTAARPSCSTSRAPSPSARARSSASRDGVRARRRCRSSGSSSSARSASTPRLRAATRR